MTNIRKLKVLVVLYASTFVLTACTTNNISTDTYSTIETLATQETTQGTFSTFPDVDMNGRVFTIMGPEYSIDRFYYVAEDETGEPVNDAAYRRNAEIEDKFNISIAVIGVENMDCAQALNRSIAAGEDTIDLVVPHPTVGFTGLLTNGLLYNLNDFEYVDLSKPCWNSYATTALDINGKLFLTKGDLTVTSQGMGGLVYNEKLAQGYGLDDPYQYVSNGTWTMEKLIEMTKGIYHDINGDGNKDIDDIYGYMGSGVDYSYIYGSGLKVAQVNKEGKGELTLSDPRLYTLADKLYDLIQSPDSFYTEKSNPSNTFEAWNSFINGKCLFTMWDIGTYASLFRPIEFEFSLLPMPKLDETQESYYTQSIGGTIGVPVNVKDPDNTGIIVQSLMEGSYKYLRPAYIDVTLFNKCLQNEKSQEVMDILLNNTDFDIGFAFIEGNDLTMIMKNTVLKGNKDVTSYYEKYAASSQLKLDAILEKINK